MVKREHERWHSFSDVGLRVARAPPPTLVDVDAVQDGVCRTS